MLTAHSFYGFNHLKSFCGLGVVQEGSTDNCLREMLKVWLKRVEPPPSRCALVSALEDVGEEEVANTLTCIESSKPGAILSECPR